jgi:hypothetical protein
MSGNTRHLIASLPSLIHFLHAPRSLWKPTIRSAGRDRLVTMKPPR